MKFLSIVWWALLVTACTTEEERRAAELEADQGPCEGLDRATCELDDRCQQTFEDSGWQPDPFVTGCVRLRSGPATTAECSTLSYDECRARGDCSLMYWQDLGSDDRPVGDPYFKSCVPETERTNELDEDQGPCQGLDRPTCQADNRCQQAFEDSGWQPMPFQFCLLLRAGPATTTACHTLAFDECRARPDCSPLYWQDLGPNDAPVGDPYFKTCMPEA